MDYTKFTTITRNNYYICNRYVKSQNPLTLIGSITGIFPLFMLIGNKLFAKIDCCKKRGKEDEIAMEERGVLGTN